jgi:DivIVA domain-containing protein
MKKKDATSDGASEWSSVPMGRITPADVQEKEFRVARFGAGYRIREVDEFLDQVTDALSALTAENERLLRGAGDRAPASSPPSMRPTAGAGDPAAVDAFLRREKGFLQDLGALVQAHAEELRSMVRSVRRDATAPAAEVSPAKEPRVEPAPTPMAGSEAPPEALPEAPSGTPKEPGASPEEASTDPEAIEATQAPAPDVTEGDRVATEEPPSTTTGGVADEPIRLEEPEPARSRRSDEDEDSSLRELFWGEE